MMDLVNDLDEEQKRAAEGGLSEEELALFDLCQRENLSKKDRERVKLASKGLLESLLKQLTTLGQWTEKEETQTEVQMFILDRIFEELPTPPFTQEDKKEAAQQVFRHVLQQSVRANFTAAA